MEDLKRRRLAAAVRIAEVDVALAEDKLADLKASNPHRGTYHLMGDINIASSFNAMRAFERFERRFPTAPIEFVITSPGGSLVEGFALYDHILLLRRTNPEIKVTTVGLGLAGSMAGIILQAGDVRALTRGTWLLIHESSFNVEGSVGEVKDRMDWVERIQNRIIDVFVTRAKLSRRQFIAKWKRKDWWLSAEEALEFGFVDEIR